MKIFAAAVGFAALLFSASYAVDFEIGATPYHPTTQDPAIIRLSDTKLGVMNHRSVIPQVVDGHPLLLGEWPHYFVPWPVDAGTHKIRIKLNDFNGTEYGTFSFDLKSGRKYRIVADRNPQVPKKSGENITDALATGNWRFGTLKECEESEKQNYTYMLKLIDDTDGHDVVVATIPVLVTDVHRARGG